MSLMLSILGTPSTRASMIHPNVSWSCVCLKSWLSITLALTSFLSSMTTLIPSLEDSSLISVIPSILLFLTRSTIFFIRSDLFTIYGSSVTTMRCFPLFIVSISVIARTFILPRPVLYASFIPCLPSICAPVGKSGPFTMSMISSISVSRPSSTLLSMIFMAALIVSFKLCGGILVAIPTAIPDVPFTNRLG